MVGAALGSVEFGGEFAQTDAQHARDYDGDLSIGPNAGENLRDVTLGTTSLFCDASDVSMAEALPHLLDRENRGGYVFGCWIHTYTIRVNGW